MDTTTEAEGRKMRTKEDEIRSCQVRLEEDGNRRLKESTTGISRLIGLLWRKRKMVMESEDNEKAAVRNV
ncbi:hypothetical protein Pmani_029973 [Petrolisthes manimaculis]|uniref:Uncharacterized protein n=1 Tax=Petrolisthes manimaculis TaxID=1843537 RepID=A0AAE1NYV3_9EUCA|nr:hypothetical protein Pmani_029973 [Petrolisthes manimaculis]